MLSGLLAFCIVVMRCFPKPSFARLLHEAMVERPVLWLAKTKRQHVIFIVLLVAAASLIAGQVIAMFGSDALVLLSWDLSLYIDALIAASAIAIAARIAAGRGALQARFSHWRECAPRPRTAARAKTTAKRRTPKSFDDDDDPAEVFGIAAISLSFAA